jgi:peptidoglycan/LPS O-acetylase OafA/YrhL
LMLQPNDSKRNYLIDILRFLSASWVALFHFNSGIPYIDNWYRAFCKFGYLGVPVFFVISGYCICIAEEHAKTPRSFIVRRFFRIYPPYWFSVLLVCICAVALRIITGANSATALPNSPGDIVATISLYTEPFSTVHTINWVYWTLPYEVCFYLLIFFALATGRRTRWGFLLLLTAVAIFIPQQRIGILFFFNELPVFMLGYALYSIIHRRSSLLFSVVLLLLSAIGAYLKHPSFVYYSTLLVVCALILLNSHYPLKNNFFSRLGDYSYSVYLIHVPVGIYLLGFIKAKLTVQQGIGLNIIVDISLLILIILAAKLVFLKVERPSMELGRTLSS